MDYALVENGQVTRVGLPSVGVLKDGSTVSGYNNLSVDALKSEGWLPMEQNIPTYDASTQTMQFDTYVIQVDKVIQQYKVTDLPVPQPQPPSVEDRLAAAESAIATLMGV